MYSSKTVLQLKKTRGSIKLEFLIQGNIILYLDLSLFNFKLFGRGINYNK